MKKKGPSNKGRKHHMPLKDVIGRAFREVREAEDEEVRGFRAIALLLNRRASVALTALAEKLLNAETQAIAVVQLLKSLHYVTPSSLEEAMRTQPLPATELALVAAFLVGYLEAETHDSEFDVAVFGKMAMMDSKNEVVATTLMCLMEYVNSGSPIQLADRRKRKSLRRAR